MEVSKIQPHATEGETIMKRKRSRIVLIPAFVRIALVASFATGVVADQIIYHGNTKSKIFHKPDCRYYNCKACTAQFSSRQEAIDAGYRPCKICNP